jgi:PAS domain S-box-containing protein
MLVVAVVNIVYTVYFIGKERKDALARLRTTIEENDRLLKVVIAGPLYDGNLEQLNTDLDSFFSNPDVIRLLLKEYNGNISISLERAPAATAGKTVNSRVVITRGIDELGEIDTTYSTALIEQRLLQSRDQLILFSAILVLGLSGVIYLVARGLTGPIARLTAAARDMADGNLDQEIDTGGAQELSSLGQSFIRMRDAIRAKMADLAAQNEALLRTQFSIDRAKEAIFWIRADGRLLYVNEAACHSLGYTKEELLSLTVFDIDPQFPRQRWSDHWQKTRNLGSYIMETTHKAKDGRVFPVEITIDFMSFAGEEYHCSYARDITERKQAEEALRESEERLRLALMAANQGLYDLNIQTGETLVNPEYATMLGYDPAEFQETNARWIERLHPDDRERVAETYRAYVRGEIPVYAVEFRQRTKSGDWKWILSLGKIVARDSEGRPLRMLGTHTDITERKQAEEEKAKLESQLLQAQKMESVGRLAGGVAHDFNNMLSVILGYAALMKSKLPAGDPLLKNVLEIERAGMRSRDITRQLLAFSRKQIIAPKPVNLNDLITDTQTTLARLIGEDIDLRFYPEKDLWKIKFDPSQIDQILMNLAVNARDAMPDGGRLTIETANIHLDEAYCREHFECRPGHYVLLVVSDDGVGMDKETRSHIFEPFFTTKEVDKGTGLGLATIYGIVKQNGGFINVYSEPGRGTTFKIYIPRIMEEGSVTEKTEVVSLASGTGTVLLVEDDNLVRGMTAAMLEEIGYTVLVAETPLHALSLCEKRDMAIDLLLTDVVMPGMNGTELRDKVQAIRPGIKVLFMSGYTSNVIVHHGVLEEGVRFIHKPFSMHDLAWKVRDAIGGT